MKPAEFYGQDYEKRTEGYFSKFLKDDQKIMRRFHRERLAKGITPRRQDKVMVELLTIQRNYLKKPFSKATKKDFEGAVIALGNSSKAEWTKHDFKIHIKLFIRWLKPKQFPELAGWIRAGIPRNVEPKPEDMLTEEDFKKMISAAQNPMDKAMIAVLYDAIIRIYELASMTVGDVSNDDDGVRIRYSGKTGANQVIVPFAGPFLLEWMRIHPQGENPKAPLWVKDKNKQGTPLKYSGLYAKLVRITERAGIRKKTNPQSWRKSATALWIKRGLQHSAICKRGNWTYDSKAVRHYFSLSSPDADNQVLRAIGKTPKEVEKFVLAPRPCERCKTENEYNREFCKVCGMALTVEAALKSDEKKKKQVEGAVDEMKEKQEAQEKAIKLLMQYMKEKRRG